MASPRPSPGPTRSRRDRALIRDTPRGVRRDGRCHDGTGGRAQACSVRLSGSGLAAGSTSR